MKVLGRKTVVEYQYESQKEAERHEKEMLSKGWNKEATGHIFIKHFRSYSQRHREGAYL
ncbi:hypothetical protein [Bacillus sp. UMB0728]|uniref:hypothetical protein n=1 Tax=Bacillus sp. UMB0728 TaxID=2066052 RepID=UPI0015DDF67F|nr:hypothetical protein [Bacillus sp. UMB0728]